MQPSQLSQASEYAYTTEYGQIRDIKHLQTGHIWPICMSEDSFTDKSAQNDTDHNMHEATSQTSELY
jgi:hypothetical protein